MKLSQVLMVASVAGAAFGFGTLPASAQISLQGARLFICDNDSCAGGRSATDPNINFYVNLFYSFTIGGSAVDGKNSITSVLEGDQTLISFSGTFAIPQGQILNPVSQTIFFNEPASEGPVTGPSDVLQYTYTQTQDPNPDLGLDGHIDGFVISDSSGALDPTWLATFFPPPTATVDETGPYNFSNIGILAQFQSASDVPEPSTWAMLLLGFAGIGFMAYRRKSAAIAA